MIIARSRLSHSLRVDQATETAASFRGSESPANFPPRCRFTHSLSTYRLHGRDHVVRLTRKSSQTLRAFSPLSSGSRACDQSPRPAAILSRSAPRIQFSHGNVKVRFG